VGLNRKQHGNKTNRADKTSGNRGDKSAIVNPDIGIPKPDKD